MYNGWYIEKVSIYVLDYNPSKFKEKTFNHLDSAFAMSSSQQAA